jgi:hypothetical protein
MSWNGTVRCRHCYASGHNRRSCPELTQHYKEQAENGSDHSRREYEKRTGMHLDGTKVAKENRAAANPRRCTYCGARGHNRRTCGILKENKSAYAEAAIAYRRRLVDAMRSAGVGVGALVQTERWNETHCWMVTKINWGNIDHLRVANCDPVMGTNVRTLDRYNQTQWMALPALQDEIGELIENRRGLSELVGPVVLAGVPAEFFQPESLHGLMADRFDKDARSENYWDNYHGS